MSELIMQGGIIAVVGYLLVFVVLAAIWGILEISRVFFTKSSASKKEKDTKVTVTAAPAPAPVTPAAEALDDEDEDELIAVLTAAVAASMGRTTTYNLNIKSYRRVGSQSPAWNKISRQENLL